MSARRYPLRTWIVALATAGASTSAWLEFVHYRAYAAPGEGSLCAIGERIDCSSVALSKYAVLIGVPLPLWGLVAFGVLAGLSWRGSRWLLPCAALAAASGVALTAISILAVGAVCIGCELVHALSVALFVLAWRARGTLSPGWEPATAALAALPALGVLLAVRLTLPPYWAVFTSQSDLPFAQGRTEQGDPWLGAASPALTLEEFVDYTCPHCKVASAHSLRELASHSEQLRLVRRHYPRMACLPITESRCLALRMALCAGDQDRFWQADRWLFEHAPSGATLSPGDAARDLEIEPDRFVSCVSDAATYERAQVEYKRARKAHLPGAPYYATGERLVTAAAAGDLIDAL